MQSNRSAWDERADIHLRDTSGFYAVDRFRAGEDVLLDIIKAEIGDVGGRSLVQLQCHIGLETLCLARRGAVVTGLDFSERSVAAARSLASDANIAATFICGDVYAAPELLANRYDVVFVSWGSLNWLPNIRRWGEVVCNLLMPGGHLYLVEQHPMISVMKQFDGRPVVSYPWRTPPHRPTVTDAATSYNNDPSRLQHTVLHEWDHPLSDIFGALLDAGLRLDFFHEHEVLPWQRLPMMVPMADRLFRLPWDVVPMPLSFSLKASKPQI
jgi:SAM-dependent methyltransferase